MNGVKAPESENVERKIAGIENRLNNKIEPIVESFSKDIDLSGILMQHHPYLIVTINGQSASQTIGNICILANHWGQWTLTCMTKNDIDGNDQMYPTFKDGILSVPQSYGWCFTTIFKLGNF